MIDGTRGPGTLPGERKNPYGKISAEQRVQNALLAMAELSQPPGKPHFKHSMSMEAILQILIPFVCLRWLSLPSSATHI
jgi:hypothetical protein